MRHPTDNKVRLRVISFLVSLNRDAHANKSLLAGFRQRVEDESFIPAQRNCKLVPSRRTPIDLRQRNPTPVENDRRQRVGSCGDASLMNVRSILAVNERTVSASEAMHDGNNAAVFWDASNEKRAAFTARHQDQITQNRTRSFVSISNRDRQSRCGCD